MHAQSVQLRPAKTTKAESGHKNIPQFENSSHSPYNSDENFTPSKNMQILNKLMTNVEKSLELKRTSPIVDCKTQPNSILQYCRTNVLEGKDTLRRRLSIQECNNDASQVVNPRKSNKNLVDFKLPGKKKDKSQEKDKKKKKKRGCLCIFGWFG